MRVAFDLDGVLADLHTPFVRTAQRLFPELDPATVGSPDVGASPPVTVEADSDADTNLVTAPPPDIAISRRQSAAVWDQLQATENFWEGLDEIEPGRIAQIAALADQHRWEVLFITSRPSSRGRTVQRQSQRWLERKGFPLPSLYVVHGSRGQIAAAVNLDAVVDDRPENCLDVSLESKAGAILVWRGSQASVPASARRLGIVVVPTVSACLDSLVKVDQEKDGSRLVDRLRRFFSVRTRSAKS